MEASASRVQIFNPTQFVPPSGEHVTVKQVIDAYITCKLTAVTDGFCREKIKKLSMFMADFGSQLCADCYPTQLELWVHSQSQWRSDWTKKGVNQMIQAAFNWCVKSRLLKYNPFKGAAFREGEYGKPMEDADFRNILRASSALFRRVLFFLRWTGCRPGEMRALEWSFLDLERGCFVLLRHKTSHSRRDRAPRIIALNDKAIKLLVWMKRHQCTDIPYVFLNAWGRPWTRGVLSIRMMRLRQKGAVKLGVTLYGNRHEAATRLIKNGVGIKTVSEILGHSNCRMTERYLHIAGDLQHLHEALNRPSASIVGSQVNGLSAEKFSPPTETGVTTAIAATIAKPAPELSQVPVKPVEANGHQNANGNGSLENLMQMILEKFDVKPRKTPKAPSVNKPVQRQRLLEAHKRSLKAWQWAQVQHPRLVKASYQEVFEWLLSRADCPWGPLPPTYLTFGRYVSIARHFYGGTEEQLGEPGQA